MVILEVDQLAAAATALVTAAAQPGAAGAAAGAGAGAVTAEVTSAPLPRYGVIWAQASGVAPGWEAQPGGGAIGRDGTMPWHLPADLQWFKKVTAGATVIMGRRTWESLPSQFRPLPGRQNIVVTAAAAALRRGVAGQAETTGTYCGATLAEDLPQALGFATATAVWVIGGGQLYRAALAGAATAVLTQLQLTVTAADTFAPALDPAHWQLVASSATCNTAGAPAFKFTVWQPRQV